MVYYIKKIRVFSKVIFFDQKLGLPNSYEPNSLKFHPVKRMNYKFPK